MKQNSINQVLSLGVTYDDATALRRISMTLRRWFELECGLDNGAIERDDDGKPYWKPAFNSRKYRVADRENGACKRLAKIMAAYPDLTPFVQCDPRGCALYLLRPNDVPEGKDASAYYSRGIAVY
jgi:hypothetical protein